MIYEWKIPMHTADAQTAGEMCEELEKSGGLTPKRLVDANRDENAPLHSEFEWDDSVAGELYRESQAGNIIRHLVVSREESGETPTVPVRAFFSVEQGCGYENVQTIFCDKKKTDALFEQAISELRAFQRKYSGLKNLGGVFAEIEKLSM